MASAPKFGTLTDPDSIPETLCTGPLHFSPSEPCILTFTQYRPKPHPLFNESTIEIESVVRARIALPRANAIALRDLLNKLLPSGSDKQPTTGDASGGSTSVH
jgi:hypothetical protein